MVVEIRDLTFKSDKLVQLPEHPLMFRQTYKNCADAASITQNFNLSVSGTEGYSISKTKGVSTTTAGNVGFNFQLSKETSAHTHFSMSDTVSTSTTKSENHSQAASRSQTWTVSVPPKHEGMIEIVAYQSAIEIPFSATIIVDAVLEPNQGGFTKASDLLAEADRTVPFEGTLHIDGVSEAVFSTNDLPGNASCEGVPGQDAFVTVAENVTLPIEAIKKEKFKTAKSFHEALVAAARVAAGPVPVAAHIAAGAVPVAAHIAEAQLGNAEGVSYEVLATEDIARPAPECGFNDLGVPKTGIYKAETRHYTNFVHGERVAEWNERVETFDSCED